MVQQLMSLLSHGVEWVLYLLIALSVIVLGLGVERWFALFRIRAEQARVKSLLAKALKGDQEAEAQLRAHPSVPAKMVVALADQHYTAPEALQEYIDSAMTEERSRLERNLAFLATVGSNAPFIGLFGTVLGIVNAFADLATAETTGPQVVMAGISEALVATAVGIGVAIPALVLFNIFKSRSKNLLRQAETLTKLFMAHRLETAVTSMAHDPAKTIVDFQTRSSSNGR